MKSRTTVIILGAIAIIALAGDLYFFSSGYSGSIARDAHPYLDPAQATFNDKDLLVNMHPLYQELTGIAAGKNITIYFQFLNTGSDLRINTTSYFPGSLMKVPIAMAVMKKIDAGEWTMDDKLTLTDADKNPAYGDLYKLPSGTTFTVRDLLNELLIQSDDTARSIFVRTIGGQTIEGVLTYLGLDDVVNSDLKVTAQRYSNFWRALYSAGYLSADSSEKLIQIMTQPHNPELLPAGLPSNVQIAHKMGVFGNVTADSGIVYAPGRPYILTVMIQSSSTNEINEVMKDVSRDVYEYVTQ